MSLYLNFVRMVFRSAFKIHYPMLYFLSRKVVIRMHRYKNLLSSFIQQSKEILGNNLIGIYLHGSAAMGCFNQKSDIDLLIVVKESIPGKIKFWYMNMVAELNDYAPAKGIELSIFCRIYARHSYTQLLLICISLQHI